MNIVELLHAPGDRHLTAAERDELRTCARNVETAVRIAATVENVESEIADEVVAELRERYPRFGQLQPQAWERLAADLQLVVRHDVRALRLDDPRSLDDAVLAYLSSVYSAYRLRRGFVRECFTLLRDRLLTKLDRDDAAALRPYLDRNIDVLSAGAEPQRRSSNEETVLQNKTRSNPRGDCLATPVNGRVSEGALAWPHALVQALHRTLDSESGPAAEKVLQNAGRVWGRSLAQRIGKKLTDYHEMPLAEVSAARVQASLESAFAQCGCGHIVFDPSRHATGLVEVAVTSGLSTIWAEPGTPAGDHLLAGAFAGLFSELSGVTLECLQTDYEVPGSAPARFVIGLPERLIRAADIARKGQPHDRVVEFLETTQI